MIAGFKKLVVNVKTATITFSLPRETYQQMQEMKAIAILNGGWNDYGRSVSFEQYAQLKRDYEQILDKMKNIMNQEQGNKFL